EFFTLLTRHSLIDGRWLSCAKEVNTTSRLYSNCVCCRPGACDCPRSRAVMATATSRLESFRRAVAQREILLEFYVSTNGHLWKNNTGWNSNADDLSTWYGVEVDDEGYVVKINLNKNNLKGKF
ncbi:unnamed protein product, partial [Choristocarpus tenellus]